MVLFQSFSRFNAMQNAGVMATEMKQINIFPQSIYWSDLKNKLVQKVMR